MEKANELFTNFIKPTFYNFAHHLNHSDGKNIIYTYPGFQ
jgi:hypothetical protein